MRGQRFHNWGWEFRRRWFGHGRASGFDFQGVDLLLDPIEGDFPGLNRDGSNGMPYVTHLPGRTELFLVMPLRQWDEQQPKS
jgi:hypothetical protein